MCWLFVEYVINISWTALHEYLLNMHEYVLNRHQIWMNTGSVYCLNLNSRVFCEFFSERSGNFRTYTTHLNEDFREIRILLTGTFFFNKITRLLRQADEKWIKKSITSVIMYRVQWEHCRLNYAKIKIIFTSHFNLNIYDNYTKCMVKL